MWNLEKWYKGTSFQGRNRDADVESGHVHTGEEGKGGTKWETGTDIHTVPCVKGSWGSAAWHRELSSVLCDDLDG